MKHFREDGNQDHCFYNYRCLKPLSTNQIFYVWNHLLSNVGYIFLGTLFILIVWMKERTLTEERLDREKTRLKDLKDTEEVKFIFNQQKYTFKTNFWGSLIKGRSLVDINNMIFKLKKLGDENYGSSAEKCGLCHGYKMYYTMGVTLVMIGLMSSCYHVCPTDVNYQFDMTYMYFLAIFMILNLFKARHPDITPDIVTAFSILAFSIAIGVRIYLKPKNTLCRF